jgi:hypothetical protein
MLVPTRQHKGVIMIDRITRLYTKASIRLSDERGDVPGWVLVAVMTAGLVTALWLVADTQLKTVLQRALTSVSKP